MERQKERAGEQVRNDRRVRQLEKRLHFHLPIEARSLVLLFCVFPLTERLKRT